MMCEKNSGVMLELFDVSMSFRSKKSSFENGLHHVLDSVSLKLHEGETLGVVGENGCGKTTILRLMAGIIPPDSGVIHQRSDVSSALLTIGLGFKPNLSGRDNAVIASMLQGSSQRQAESYLSDIKEFSELGNSFEEPVKTYSSGMMSRLGFTTALMTHVDIMLIDEILSVGDARFRQKAEAALRERIEGEQTVVFVSHSESQVQSLCDRVIWLRGGLIIDQGDPKSVLESYGAHVKSLAPAPC
jgi:lipopolysaccharide transport system ATP-binding protein